MENKNIIICIGRQLGSGGHDIGRMLAAEFDAKYYDRELLNLAAKESGFSKKVFERNDEQKGFFKTLFGIQTTHIGGGLYNSNISQDSLFQFQSDAIRKAAAEGNCVFVGRCADYVLRDIPNVVKIFITATMYDRITRISASKRATKIFQKKTSHPRKPSTASFKPKATVPPITTTTRARNGALPTAMTSASAPASWG